MFNGCIIYVYVKLTYSHPAVSPLIYRGALGPRKHPVHLHCVYPVNSLSGRRSRGLPANVLHNQNVVPRRSDRPPRCGSSSPMARSSTLTPSQDLWPLQWRALATPMSRHWLLVDWPWWSGPQLVVLLVLRHVATSSMIAGTHGHHQTQQNMPGMVMCFSLKTRCNMFQMVPCLCPQAFCLVSQKIILTWPITSTFGQPALALWAVTRVLILQFFRGSGSVFGCWRFVIFAIISSFWCRCATASRTQPSPAAERAAYLVSGRPSYPTQYFDLNDNDCDECLEFQNEQVFNNNSLSKKVFQVLSKLKCSSRRAKTSNEIDWMESSDEVMVPSSATTSSSAASCDMLKKPFLQQVRSFLSSIYGVSSHPHWSRCADFLRGRVAFQLQAQDDRVATHGSLEARDLGAAPDAGNYRQAGCHGLHRQEEHGAEGQRRDAEGAQHQGEETEQECRQDGHHPGHREAAASVLRTEDLAYGSEAMQPSSRVHEMPGQPVRKMVDLPGVWKPLATHDRTFGSFIFNECSPRVQECPTGGGREDRQELSRVSSSAEISPAAGQHAVAERCEGPDQPRRFLRTRRPRWWRSSRRMWRRISRQAAAARPNRSSQAFAQFKDARHRHRTLWWTKLRRRWLRMVRGRKTFPWRCRW